MKKIRNKLTKTPNIDFIVIGLDKIEAIYDSHPKNYFLLEKINDNLDQQYEFHEIKLELLLQQKKRLLHDHYHNQINFSLYN